MKQLLLRQIDNFCAAVSTKQEAREIFNDIGSKIQFPSEEEIGIIPFESLGVVKDYNGVDIQQTPDYIEINCASYIARLLNTHRWGSSSQKEVSNENVAVPTAALKTMDKYVLKQTDNNMSVAPTLSPQIKDHDINPSINPHIDKMKSSRPLSPLPTDCIEQMYSEEGPPEGTDAHMVLEKGKGFFLSTIIGGTHV